MTKAELIRKIAKNAGVPDTDAKIFFELFLKKISAIVDIGQSIFVNDFGFFHLIKGSIKKPTLNIKDNEVSEEAINLVLFSENKDLRKSDTKGLVFNIPSFDEDDYHPIDSSFSLSIGKPLIPLRGVPFDNIYIPTSGYEYRRLIESKVEKIISASEVAESEENFPTLVIDATSYNSNQVQLRWDDKSQIQIVEQLQAVTDSESKVTEELSESVRQKQELKNIAWDFGEDLSRQIEAESILDITDERINMNLNLNVNSDKDFLEHPKKMANEKEPHDLELDIFKEKDALGTKNINLDESIKDSSVKLNELLEDDNNLEEPDQEDIISDNVLNIGEEINIDNVIGKADPSDFDTSRFENEISDKEFWESTSKYFEPYKPEIQKSSEDEFANINNINPSESDNLKITDDENDLINSKDQPNNVKIEIKNNEEKSTDKIKDMIEENIDTEEVNKQQEEIYLSEKKRNMIPFIVFPLLVLIVSIALYWYLEFYNKNESAFKPVQIVLKSDNAKIIPRRFDFPVSYPYLPKVNRTVISDAGDSKIDNSITSTEIIEDKKLDQKKPEEKLEVKKIPNQKSTVSKNTSQNQIPAGNGLNVGNNIFKYGKFFAVQVASFRAKSISENEAGKYRSKGYNAFLEAAEIPNRGIWYRVRVGNFSSKEEAQSFIEKNIR